MEVGPQSPENLEQDAGLAGRCTRFMPWRGVQAENDLNGHAMPWAMRPTCRQAPSSMACMDGVKAELANLQLYLTESRAGPRPLCFSTLVSNNLTKAGVAHPFR